MTSRAVVRPRLAGSLIVLAIIVALGGGVVGATLLAPDQPPDALRVGAALTSAPVQQQQFADQRTVPVALTVTEPTPLNGNANGRVTALRAGAGAVLASGSSPLDVDGVPVIALHTTVPPYRDLAVDSTGADVSALQVELARLGYPVDRTGYYGSATSRAVKDLKAKADAVRPNGDLSLTEVLWLPAESVTPGTWTALLGSAVTAGGGYGVLPGRLTAVTATLPETLAPGARTLTLWGKSAPLDADGRATEPGFLAAVANTRDYPAAVKANDPGSLTGMVALTEPMPTLKVPPTALFGITGSQACVQSGNTVFPVTVVGSALGASLVTPDRTVTDAPDAAPTEVALGAAISAGSCR